MRLWPITRPSMARVAPIAFALAFFALGVSWSFASPPGSTNDADYHYSSIWCAWGEWDGCRLTPPDAEVPSEEISGAGNFWVPEYVRSVNCFQFASQSTRCLADKTPTLVDSNRKNSDYYPSIYYSVMRTLVLDNSPAYLQVVRIANVALAAGLIGLAVFVASPSLRRAAILAWGIAAIPWIVMYAASVHPSSWMVTGAGTFWVFLLAAITRDSTLSLRILSITGLVLSGVVALASRFDGAAWLVLGIILAAALAAGSDQFASSIKTTLVGGASIITLGGLVVAFNWTRLGLGTAGVPEWNRATDQAHPILKVLLEFPGWIASFWGAQPPSWIPSDTEIQRSQAGYTPVGLSENLGDFYFPSAVGYLIAGAGVSLVLICFGYLTRRNWLALILLASALLVGVLGMRAAVFFGPQNLLSRYYFPWLILALAAVFFLPHRRQSLVTRAQAIALAAMLITGGSIAWLAVAGRYAVNLSGTFTNFGQPVVWWWSWGPSRLVWFLIASGATALWVTLTLLAARSSLESEHSDQSVSALSLKDTS